MIEELNQTSSNSLIRSTSNQIKSLNILANTPIEINKKFIIEFTKENDKSFSKEDKKICKICKFTADWNYDEIKYKICDFSSDEYPNLFVFILEIKNCDSVSCIKTFQDIFLTFGKNRPAILQLSLVDEYVTKFYYKEEFSNNFFEIGDLQMTLDEIVDFTTFLGTFLTGKIERFEDEMINKLPHITNSALILRFLRMLKLSDEFLSSIVLRCAAYGSKCDLLAALDTPFGDDSKIVSIDPQGYLSCMFNDGTSEEGHNNLSEEPANSDASSLSSTLSDDDNSNSSISNGNDNLTSVLHTSILHSNSEIINFLMTDCTHLIQQLSFNHQTKISTTAFNLQQFDILCDLLEFLDFPFPQNFNIKSNNHQRINQIVNERKMLANAIKMEDSVGIKNYNESHIDQHFAFNTKNKSALFQAVRQKKFTSLYYLKSYGFQATEFWDLDEVLSADELKQAKKQASKQRRKNVDDSIKDPESSVNLLYVRSSIHNRKISKEQQAIYRSLIRKWLGDINRILFGPELLNVAASCENLKIIFDFESQSVESVSMEGSNAVGSTYPTSKWIFIGAKLLDKKREQQIKGVLAHELCHYVMRLVFENKEHPYYKNMVKLAEIFDAIVKAIDKWSSEEAEDPDDECNGIISSVYQLYDSKDFHPELIVRVVQILAEFDDDEAQQTYLQAKYEELFEFFRNHVLVELQRFNMKLRNDVRKLNKISMVLENLLASKLVISSSKNIKDLTNSETAIIVSNVPKLMLIDVAQNLKKDFGEIYDSQNIFITSENLKNSDINKQFEDIFGTNQELNIFIDCSANVELNLDKLPNKVIFIVSSEAEMDKLLMNIKNFDRKMETIKVDYFWNDLTVQSKKLLLDIKINFQGYTETSLSELFECKFKEEDGALIEVHEDLSEVIDEQLLNLLINNSKISLNCLKTEDKPDLQLILQPRNFIKKGKQSVMNQYAGTEESTEVIKMSHNNLLQDIKFKKYVLISDIAGTGKSLSMKSFAKTVRKMEPTRWVNYVDLKEFINVFKSQKNDMKFLTFVREKILELQDSFEGKIFSKLYAIGKTTIFFDAFDEIAPDCAESVLQLAESFEYNDGNQLWIATRDHFEIDLEEKLRIDCAYKFEEFTENDSVNLIARTWTILDINDTNQIKTTNNVESSPNFKNNLESARDIFKNISIDINRSIGLPLLSKMIADGFRNNRDQTMSLSKLKIYKKFAQNLFVRWSYEKGDIRKQANVASQNEDLNFWIFHQFMAINSMFPEFVKFLFPDKERRVWTDEEIIACGIIKKVGDIFYFIHETFREFFVADFVASSLENSKISFSCIRLFGKILTDSKCKVVRMFLNEALENHKNLEEIEKLLRIQFGKSGEKLENISEFFTNNLEVLAEIVMKVHRYTNVKNIIKKNFLLIVLNTDNSKLYLKFQNFIFDSEQIFHREDLKEFIIQQKVFHNILSSKLDIEVFEDLLEKVKDKLWRGKFMKRELLKQSDSYYVNIFQSLCMSPNINAQKFKKFIAILQKYFESYHIFGLITNCCKDGGNLLQIFVQTGNKTKLKELWTELQILFESYNVTRLYNKNFITHSNTLGENILHRSLLCNDIEFHKTFWDILLDFFKNRNELKDFILKKNKFEMNFIHSVAIGCGSQDLIELIFKFLKDNFDDAQYKEIIHTKNNNSNLIQSSARKPGTSVKRFKFFWDIFKNSFETSETFLLFLEEEDKNAACFLSLPNEIFEFIMQELEKIATSEEIKKLLNHQLIKKSFFGFIMTDKNTELCRNTLEKYK